MHFHGSYKSILPRKTLQSNIGKNQWVFFQICPRKQFYFILFLTDTTNIFISFGLSSRALRLTVAFAQCSLFLCFCFPTPLSCLCPFSFRLSVLFLLWCTLYERFLLFFISPIIKYFLLIVMFFLIFWHYPYPIHSWTQI